MIPLLEPHIGSTGPAVRVPPPPRFRAIRGTLWNVRIGVASLPNANGYTEVQKTGLRYERRVQADIRRAHPQYRKSPTLFFNDESGARAVIPDGLLLLEDRTIIVEIKIRHMPEAWWQLDQLYRPVVEAYRGLPVSCVEVVRSYDPSVPFPCNFDLIDSIDALGGFSGEFGVLRCK